MAIIYSTLVETSIKLEPEYIDEKEKLVSKMNEEFEEYSEDEIGDFCNSYLTEMPIIKFDSAERHIRGMLALAAAGR